MYVEMRGNGLNGCVCMLWVQHVCVHVCTHVCADAHCCPLLRAPLFDDAAAGEQQQQQ